MSTPHQATDRGLPPGADWVRAAYLMAVVAVYGPWTESKVISAEERKRAQARVHEARFQLGRIAPPPHTPPPSR